MEDEWVVKICIVGSNSDLNYDFGARTADNIHGKENLLSLGVAIHSKRFEIDKQRVKLFMFVIRGQPGSLGVGLRRSYFEGSSGCVILFNKGVRETFVSVTDFYNEYGSKNDYPVILVGIKTKTYKEEIGAEAPFHRLMESEEEVSTEEGQQLARELNTSYYETTLKDKDQVSTILKALAKKYLESLR